jgi:uncharacterized iron-regulated membrane protein
MHNALVVFHRWLALITGVLLILIALSGAVLVFEGPIADAAAVHVVPGAHLLSLDSLGARAIAADGGGIVAGIAPGRAIDEASTVAVTRDTSETDYVVNPYTGDILRRVTAPTRLQAIVRRIHQFHTSFLAGSTGNAVVALLTLSSLVLVLTGLIIWWRDRLWRIRWSASWKRVIFDLHHALGVFAAVILVFITGTGVWMGYSRQIDPLVLALNRTPVPAGRPKQTPPDPSARPISIDSVVSLAHGAVPGAPVVMVDVSPGAPAFVALRYPEDHTPGGRSRVFIDRYRGTVLRATNTRTAEAGTRLMNLQRPLHTGDIFGGASRIVWFLAALILASQAVTGIMMWWNGRAARAALARSTH